MDTKGHVAAYLQALDEVLAELKPYIEEGRLEELPHGPIAHSDFRRLV